MEENTSRFAPEDPLRPEQGGSLPSAGEATPLCPDGGGTLPRPRESMESCRRDPREVVEAYRQPGPREVVETYSRPLPWLPQKPPQIPSPAPLPRQKRRRWRGFWICMGCLALLAILAAGLRFLTRPRLRPWETQDPPYYYDSEDEPGRGQPVTIPTWPFGQGASLLVEREHGADLTAQEIYSAMNPSVVSVMADLADDYAMSSGTGVIFTADGYVLTNYHVVEGGASCAVMLDSGRRYEALYVAGDAESDLAVLKVEAEEPLPAAPFGDSDLLTVGDKVYAIGSPLGLELRGTFTDGIVSAINRDVWVDTRTMTLIQTNAALNSGNSGGPLINQYGQVVGINTIKMTSDYSNVEGLGFAIPSALIDRLVNDLLTYGEVQPEPVLGIMVSRASEEVETGVWGIRVESVTEGYAAHRAGIQEGDYVILAAGRPVQSSQDLLRARRQCHIGDTLRLTIWRAGETMEVELHLLDAE